MLAASLARVGQEPAADLSGCACVGHKLSCGACEQLQKLHPWGAGPGSMHATCLWTCKASLAAGLCSHVVDCKD